MIGPTNSHAMNRCFHTSTEGPAPTISDTAMKAVIPVRTVTTGLISLSPATLQIDFFYLAVLKVESSLARVKNMPAPIALLVAVRVKIFMLCTTFRASDRFVIARVVHLIIRYHVSQEARVMPTLCTGQKLSSLQQGKSQTQ